MAVAPMKRKPWATKVDHKFTSFTKRSLDFFVVKRLINVKQLEPPFREAFTDLAAMALRHASSDLRQSTTMAVSGHANSAGDGRLEPRMP